MIDPRLAELIPELPRTFDLVKGELVQGETRTMIRYRGPGARGMDESEPEIYFAPVRDSVELDGRIIHVGWWAVHGFPKVAAWVR